MKKSSLSSKKNTGTTTLKKPTSFPDVILVGSIPSKKNSRQLFVKNGRMMNIPSKNYKEWHKDASLQLSGALSKLSKKSLPLDVTSSITLSFWSPNKRKYDLTNKAESVMDLLVDNGVLQDDNYAVCPCVQLVYMGVDYKRPRVEIEVS